LSSRQELLDLFKKSPEKKDELLQKLKNLSKTAFITDILENSKEAYKKSIDKKEEINSYLEGIIDEKRDTFDKNFDKSISNFESNLS
jgi:hypothetical protein